MRDAGYMNDLGSSNRYPYKNRSDVYTFANTERRGTALWSLSVLQIFGYDHVTPRPEMQKPKKESYTAGVNNLEILGAGMVTLIKFLNEDQQI